MKTTTSNQQQTCESHLSSGLWQWPLWRVSPSIFLAQSKKFYQTVLATSRAQVVSLASLVQEVNSNNRLLTALFLMLAMAPFSACLYIFFDKTEVVNNWFFVNYFNLFIGLRGNLLAFFTILGIFFLFPARYKASYLLAAPLGFIIADIVKKLLATTNEEYNAIISFPYAVLGVCLIFGILKSLDYFLYKHHHIKRKYWAHIVGIIRSPGISNDQKIKILDTEIKSVEKEYYAIY